MDYDEKFSRQMESFLDMQFSRGLMKRMRGGLRSTGALFRKKR